MKKILVTIIFIYTLTLNLYAAELKDCSEYSKLSSKYLACKATNIIKDTTNYQKEEWSKGKNKLMKKD